jgi:hypothetical protein
MVHQDQTLEPVVADPVPAAWLARPATAAVVILGGILWASGLLSGAADAPSHVPATPADLAAGVITPIDRGNPSAVAAAVSALAVPAHDRQVIERQVLDGHRRIGWIVLTDSMDPDGDTVRVDAGGISQVVVLTKAWVPVPVLADAGPITVTGVRDGGGGGITVALATRAGPIKLRALAPGERIEVAAP